MVAGAREIVQLLKLDIIAKNIIKVEMSGVIGDYSRPGDARKALSILVKCLVKESHFSSVWLSQFTDEDVKILSPLLMKNGVTDISITDCELGVDAGVLDIRNCLIQNVPGSPLCPCDNIVALTFHSVLTDEGDATAKAFGDVLKHCKSISFIVYSCCRPYFEGSHDLVMAFSNLLDIHPNVQKILSVLSTFKDASCKQHSSKSSTACYLIYRTWRVSISATVAWITHRLRSFEAISSSNTEMISISCWNPMISLATKNAMSSQLRRTACNDSFSLEIPLNYHKSIHFS